MQLGVHVQVWSYVGHRSNYGHVMKYKLFPTGSAVIGTMTAMKTNSDMFMCSPGKCGAGS